MIASWDIAPCSLEVDQRFRGAYCLHHQGDLFQQDHTVLHPTKLFFFKLTALRNWNSHSCISFMHYYLQMHIIILALSFKLIYQDASYMFQNYSQFQNMGKLSIWQCLACHWKLCSTNIAQKKDIWVLLLHGVFARCSEMLTFLCNIITFFVIRTCYFQLVVILKLCVQLFWL
jgi:hypothetical protein